MLRVTVLVGIGTFLAGLAAAGLFQQARIDAISADLQMERNYSEMQADIAKKRLASLVAERDAKQKELVALRADQDERDQYAQREIDRITDEFNRRPTRVRLVKSVCPGDSGLPNSGPASPSGDSAGDSTEGTGVLHPENTRRLGIALNELEKMSAAYASCRAALLNER